MPLIITGASGGGLTGLGTPGQVPLWTAPRVLGNSKIVQTGSGLSAEVNIPGEATDSFAVGVGVQLASSLLIRSIAIGRTIVPAVGLNSGVSGNQERIYIGQGFVCTKADDNKVFHRTVAIGPNIQLGPNDNSESVVMGQDARLGVTANSNSAVLIGARSRGNSGENSVGIGADVILNGDRGVAIGALATTVSNGASLGRNARAEGTNGSVAIGQSAQATGNESMAIGSLSLVAAGHTGSIALGRNGRTSAANQLSIGANPTGGNQITDIVVGAGTDPAIDTTGLVILRASNTPNGSNLRGWNLDIGSGLGTGNAATGAIRFSTPDILASGSTLQTRRVQFSILQSTGLAGAANLRVDNVTHSPGAAVGTLNTAPSAGDPDFWLPINIGGTVYKIPCWQ